MNHKLRNTLRALSTTGLLMVVGLLAGSPQFVDPARQDHAALAQDPDWAEGTEAGVIDAQPRGVRQDAPRLRASNHRKFALPYFSFAQGARRHGG